jgi:hypothetical protein
MVGATIKVLGVKQTGLEVIRDILCVYVCSYSQTALMGIDISAHHTYP